MKKRNTKKILNQKENTKNKDKENSKQQKDYKKRNIKKILSQKENMR